MRFGIRTISCRSDETSTAPSSAAASTACASGLPLNADIQFLNAADPAKDVIATARVIDTQGRIARVQVEMTQEDQTVAEVSEMVFLRQQ